VPQFKTLWRLCLRPGKPNRFRLCLLHVRHLCQAVVGLFFLACIVPGAGPRNVTQVGMTSQRWWV
jgi:hypothetical protein